MTALTLDAEAVAVLADERRDAHRFERVRAALRVAERLRRDVVVPAAVLAELYRGGRHDRTVDAYLARANGYLEIVPTDRVVARRIGNLLGRAAMRSDRHVDAAVVAITVLAGGGVILTHDPDDLRPLADGHPNVHVEAI